MQGVLCRRGLGLEFRIRSTILGVRYATCRRTKSFLNGVHFAVVSTIASDGMPHQTVMWYMLDGEQLLLSTPRDNLKHKHLKRDSRLSVCVEKGYTYVTLVGTVTLDENPTTARADYKRLGKRYRSTFNPLIMVGFLWRNAVSKIEGMFKPTSVAPAKVNRMQDMLSRERITLHMTIEKIQTNGFE